MSGRRHRSARPERRPSALAFEADREARVNQSDFEDCSGSIVEKSLIYIPTPSENSVMANPNGGDVLRNRSPALFAIVNLCAGATCTDIVHTSACWTPDRASNRVLARWCIQHRTAVIHPPVFSGGNAIFRRRNGPAMSNRANVRRPERPPGITFRLPKVGQSRVSLATQAASVRRQRRSLRWELNFSEIRRRNHR